MEVPIEINLYSKIKTIISSIDIESIGSDRKKVLQPLIEYIQNKKSSKQEIYLIFICTHNSRRSQLAQVWAQTLAFNFGLKDLFSYSGGTEVSVFFPTAIQSLKNSGFEINTIKNGTQPRYAIKYSDNAPPIVGFSKIFNDDSNPKSNFAAVMTCSQADMDCPYIPKAEQQISIHFEDPKIYDNTPQQLRKYNERNLQIATELFYVFSQIKS